MLSCSQPKQDANQNSIAIQQITNEINAALDSIKKDESLNELISEGFTELGFKIMDDSLKVDSSIERKIRYSQLCINNGDFEQGLKYIHNAYSTKYNFELLDIKAAAALNKTDTAARALLDDMAKDLAASYSPARQIEYLIQKGYYLHNCKHYDSAIATLNDAIDTCKRYQIDSIYLARIYRKLGNCYNDLTRNKIEPNKTKDPIYINGMSCYAKEKEILDTRKTEYNKAIGNQITTGMLMVNVSVDSYRCYHLEALKNVITAFDTDYLITKDPVYASVCFNHLSADNFGNFTATDKRLADSLIDLNQALITQKAIISFYSAYGFDIQLCFPQSSYKYLYSNSFKDTFYKASPLDLINCSNLTKYSNLQPLCRLKEAYATNAQQVINCWALLHEIKLLGISRHNGYYENTAQQLLSRYSGLFEPINSCIHHKKLNDADITKLTQYCIANSTTIYDYQLFYGNSHAYLITIMVDALGLHINQTIEGKDFPLKELTALNSYMLTDSIAAYGRLAAELYGTLGLSKIKTSKVIICAAEQLERLPFEALATSNQVALKWDQINYFFDDHSIRYIPNIENLLNEHPIQTTNERINVLFSNADNFVLPYNEKLIKNLNENYYTVLNSANDFPILHIMSHTRKDETGNIQFETQTDTVSIFSGNYAPELAVLHGCNSGAGNYVNNEGFMSLSRMFLYNRTKSVINSYWNVDNGSSAELFMSFYGEVAKGKSIGYALHTSQMMIKNNPVNVEWHSPFYWANWKLIGADLIFQ